MKALYALLVLLLVSPYLCESCEFLDDTKGLSDCNSRSLDKEDGEAYCCLIKYKYQGTKLESCIPATQDEYDDIKGFIKTLENSDELDLDDVSVNCGSNYIIISLFSLILLFL